MKHPFWLKTALLAASLTLTSCGPQNNQNQPANIKDIREANALLDKFGRQELVRSPETTSRLGVRAEKAGYIYTNKVDDRSQAGFERARLLRLEMFEDIQLIDAAKMPANTRTTLDVTKAALESLIEISAFGHGQVSLGFSRPYAADQLSGAYIDLPDLLINRQIIANKDEALAYIERLSKVADAIVDDGRRMRADAHAGITPPDFILQHMISVSKQFSQANNTEDENMQHPLVTSFENLTSGIGDLSSEERSAMMRQVEKIVQDDILPAYLQFEETLETLAQNAASTPGIWSISNGSAYYESALKFYTGQTVKPEALHRQGLEIVASLNVELDIALQEAGLADGTTKQRLSELNAQDDQYFPNTEEGHTALLAVLSARLDTVRPDLNRLIGTPPRAGLRVAKVPDFLAANAPGAYYLPAAADGTAPAIFYINLRDTSEWPAYSLPTLFYHEAIPGHHLENAMIAEQGNLPIVRQLIWLPVYGEGWALYAEDLADELGLYADDPFGRVGYLQSLLFRAARLVVDTGLHHKRWSREEAITYLVDTTGQSRSAMETEIDRYTVWPGQAATYMVGRQFIWELRQRSQTALGEAFDLATFHDIILSNGPRPLALVEADIEAWIASQLPR